jgi:hypothetical protein
MKNSVPPPSYVKTAGFQGRIDPLPESRVRRAEHGPATDRRHRCRRRYADPERDSRFQFRLFHGLTAGPRGGILQERRHAPAAGRRPENF